MNMHITEPTRTNKPWRKTTHDEKVALILKAYKCGNDNLGSITRYICEYLNCEIHRESVASVYRVNKKNGGVLKTYTLTMPQKGIQHDIDMDLAKHLWSKGVAVVAMAKQLGVKPRQLYDLADNYRQWFPVRRPKVNGPGFKMSEEIIEELTPKPIASKFDHPDRVTRYTSLGYPVTMPRVTFLDGKAGQ